MATKYLKKKTFCYTKVIRNKVEINENSKKTETVFNLEKKTKKCFILKKKKTCKLYVKKKGTHAI